MDTHVPLIFVSLPLDLDPSVGTSHRFWIVDAGLPSVWPFSLFCLRTKLLLFWLVALLVRLLSPNEVLPNLLHHLRLAATQPVLAPSFLFLTLGPL